HGARLPALLGIGIPHRWIPLRSCVHSGTRSEWGAAVESPVAGIAGLRPGPQQVQADRRSLGRRGLYQVGSFPAYGRWAEWNGKYRDSVRKFIKGELGMVGEISNRIQGSPDLYWYRGPTASLNFLTCHDGFTLRD